MVDDFIDPARGIKTDYTMYSSVPHTLTRLKPSNLHVGGVGVFAITDIPNNYVIFPCTGKTVRVSQSLYNELAPGLQKMYNDFAMHLKKENAYIAPQFDRMSMFWYICHSDTHNCRYDDAGGGKYISIREITEGEEISINYKDFDDCGGEVTALIV